MSHSFSTRKILSLPETIKQNSTFRAKALRRELAVNSRRRAFARNVEFCFIVSGSERTFTFRISLNTLSTLATLVRDLIPLGLVFIYRNSLAMSLWSYCRWSTMEILCVSEIIFSFNDPRQQITDELRYMKTRL